MLRVRLGLPLIVTVYGAPGWTSSPRPAPRFDHLVDAFPELGECPNWARECLETEAHYTVYLERQQRDINRVWAEERLLIPEGFDYGRHSGFSNEIRAKLESIRPRSMAEAAAIEGMTPTTLVLLLALIQRHSSKHVA